MLPIGTGKSAHQALLPRVLSHRSCAAAATETRLPVHFTNQVPSPVFKVSSTGWRQGWSAQALLSVGGPSLHYSQTLLPNADEERCGGGGGLEKARCRFFNSEKERLRISSPGKESRRKGAKRAQALGCKGKNAVASRRVLEGKQVQGNWLLSMAGLAHWYCRARPSDQGKPHSSLASPW